MDVLVISGETGCGKSTQIPQFIFEEFIDRGVGGMCNIVVTQPRRISAIGLANRVSKERSEEVGESGMSFFLYFFYFSLSFSISFFSSVSLIFAFYSVGYQIRMESEQSANTRILFCTTGVVLRRLMNPGALDNVTHLIVDECHERNLETDFLLILLKQIAYNQRNKKNGRSGRERKERGK
jgi:HrpA-like RNA helicase